MMLIRKEILWDIDTQHIDLEKNKALIIERVLSFGTIAELTCLFNIYGREVIRNSVKNVGYFDVKTFEFITGFLKIKKSEMKCYTKKQSAIQHWH